MVSLLAATSVIAGVLLLIMHPRDPKLECLLNENGFVLDDRLKFIDGSRFQKTIDNRLVQSVCWYGGPYAAGQLFLGIGDVPPQWPLPRHLTPKNGEWRTAFSAMIHQDTDLYLMGKDDEAQIKFALAWLTDVGFLWLEQPDQMDDAAWANKLLFIPESWERFCPLPTVNQTEYATEQCGERADWKWFENERGRIPPG